MYQLSEKYNLGKRNIILGLIINLALMVFKFFAGVSGDSRVMVADAIHTLSDVVSDIAAFFGIKFSCKPEDSCHQFGHGKFETLSTLTVSIILLIVAYDIGRSALFSLINYNFLKPKPIALIAAIVSIIAKEILYQVTIRVGKKINSKVLEVNAWHHRSDALSSIAATIGIIGSMIGVRALDSIAAIVVALLIFKLAIDYGKDAINELLENAIPKEMQDKILEIASLSQGVKGVHKLRTRKVGNKYFADIHVLVAPELTVKEGHDISDKVVLEVKSAIDNDINVIVHIEPFNSEK